MVPTSVLRYSRGRTIVPLLVLLWISLVKNVFCNLAASGVELSDRQVQKLVPSRRALPLVARDAAPLSHLSPKHMVVLDYTHPSLGPESIKATVTFAAHPGRPIILLEDMDHLFHSVTCGGDYESGLKIVHIGFFSEGAYSDALDAWNAFHTSMLHIITLHPTCNPSDERAAWSVLSILSDRSQLTLHLVVEPLALNHVGRSYNVRFNQPDIIGGWGLRHSRGIQRRKSFPNEFQSNNHSSLSGQRFSTANFPDVGSGILAAISNSNLEFVCVDCDLSYNFKIDMEFDVEGIDITAASVGVTVEEFEQSAVVQISMNQTLNIDTSADLFTVPLTPTSVPALFTIGPAIGVALEFNFNMNSSINFTVGASGSISKGATASVNFLDQNNGTVTQNWGITGENNTFRLNGGTFDMDASISLSPFIELAALIHGSKGIMARISERVPQLYVNASKVSAVNRDCNPLSDNDFESFGTAYVVDGGVNLTTVASISVDLGALGDIINFPDTNWEKTLYTFSNPLMNKKCSVIGDDGSGGQSARRGLEERDNSLSSLMPAVTGTLLPAASAVPTFDLAKIVSYYSANGHLPTNVNYNQMAQVTTVPDSISGAVKGATKNQSGCGRQRGFGVGGQYGTIFVSFLVIYFVFL